MFWAPRGRCSGSPIPFAVRSVMYHTQHSRYEDVTCTIARCEIFAHAHQGKHHPQAVNGRLRRPRALRCRWVMSSYEGDHVIAIDDMYITRSTAVSARYTSARNPPTATPSTRDDVTLRGSPAACSLGCEAPQPASCISFIAGMALTHRAEAQLTCRSPICMTRPRGHPQRTQSSCPKYVHRPPR